MTIPAEPTEPALSLVDPVPEDLVFPRQRVRPGMPDEELPRFRDTRWPLSFLNHGETVNSSIIEWARCPESFRASMMRGAWAVLNMPAPEALLRMVRRTVLSPDSLRKVFAEWIAFASWLDGQGITAISDVTSEDMDEYTRHLRGKGRSWAHDARTLNNLSRLWAYAPYLQPQDRLAMPPWEEPSAEIKEFLGQNNDPKQGENTLPVIHPAVMSPLLVWALRVVLDLAPDIIAARWEHQRLLDRIPDRAVYGQRSVAVDYLRKLVAKGRPIPAYRGALTRSLDAAHAKRNGGSRAFRAFPNLRMIAGTLGVTAAQVSNALHMLRDELDEQHFGDGAPLNTRITGAINGKPWTESIDFQEAQDLALVLSAACLIVTGYLSGMRAKEVLHLERDCCTREDRPGGTTRYMIAGRYFKTATDEDGNHLPGGEVRDDPWTVIEPVHRAIAALEKLHDHRLLFPRDLSRIPRKVTAEMGDAMTNVTASDRIEAFIAWANKMALAHDRPHEMIPEDPEGAITLVRFRRTVAWYIYRQPGGRIALGVQYGHVATAMGESYAGRSRSDMLQVLDHEHGLALADTLASAAERLAAGEGISGPAAGRYIDAAREFQNKFAGTYMGSRQLAALRTNPKLQVFEDPLAFLTCNHDPFKALCDPHRGRGPRPQQTPDQSRCNPACANISRSDSQIEAARSAVAEIDDEVASGINPYPIARRQLQCKAEILQTIERHEAERIFVDPPDEASQ
ncbi:hypothetical protein [Streptomyces sp. NPDC101149]|uniref:hypothetical protein n=1 Tax=Streptomyces sp. NPDC101149 TaxID=3366113 RepID=UPI003801B6E8